jgi:DNA-binding response OmpR family regulator
MSKILVIEDNPVFSRMLCNWITKKGWQAEQVSSAAQARKLLAVTDADIILSDMRLPDGDGVEILGWMNEHQIRIPFVVMTGYAEVSSAVRAMKLGAVDYLPKNNNSMQLFETIDRIYRIHQLIQREATGTPEEFAERFNIRRRQLYNILEEFKDYGAHICYNRIKQTFYYANDFEIIVKINVLPLSNQEQKTILAGNIENNSFRAIPLHKPGVILLM